MAGGLLLPLGPLALGFGLISPITAPIENRGTLYGGLALSPLEGLALGFRTGVPSGMQLLADGRITWEVGGLLRPFDGLTLGGSLARLPSEKLTWQLGASLEALKGAFVLAVQGDFRDDNRGNPIFRTGVEVNPLRLFLHSMGKSPPQLEFSLRFGLAKPVDEVLKLVAGAGLKAGPLALDLAFDSPFGEKRRLILEVGLIF